ncbi:glycoside hydrolase family 97 protein [Sphingomonas xinjiangensis]|uniref:Alpha-glucosidase n=1 Tax=Sphingomonas xinjiangensis TaxID=643568 RepID=A0A840YRL9_9SPHN|nr:glycoside hydrolase family 97 protein [Sphingomonas xinjiangensis]MBB5711803.1 alpha-glucosidase [Sphingomonas xinjiangensis]
MKRLVLLMMLVMASTWLQGCSRDEQGAGAPRLVSPDGRIAIDLSRAGDGQLAFRVTHDRAEIVARSPIGLTLSSDEGKAASPLLDLTILSFAKREGRERYAVVGTAREVDRPYAALMVHARERSGEQRLLDVELRAYDGGAAFRLVVPPQARMGLVRIGEETTAFRFPANYACLGVHQSELANSHEGEYMPVAANALKRRGYYDLPLVCRTGRGGETLAISESNVENYAGAYLVALPERHPGVAVKLTPHLENPKLAVDTPMVEGGVASPWRVIMIADRPEALVASTLIDDLAAPSRVLDPRWITPGKAAWGWWSGLMARDVDTPGHNQATYRYYIDFAGRFGLPYYMIDWGWAWRDPSRQEKNPLADITRTTDGVNLPALVRYARERKVRLWLWVNWKALDGRMEEALALYQRLGIAGIKVDYLDRQDQEMVAFYHRLLSTAAKHHLMVNIHASFVPRGLDRTYPNYMTQEGVMGVEYNRWSKRDTAGNHVRLAYTRAIIGPMDYAPGAFRNVTPAAFVARKHAPEVMTTRAHQLAMFVVFPSPLTMLADAPGAYVDAQGGLAPGADFVRLVPTAWDETQGIAGEFGNMIAVARRQGSRWFVGVLNDEQARNVILPLSFLGAGKWRLASWRDGATPKAVVTGSGQVHAGRGGLRVRLEANGGAALMLTPQR